MSAEFISFDRAAGKISTVSQPLGGTWGQISFGRLCEVLEVREVRFPERIVAFVIEGDMLKYQVERHPSPFPMPSR